MTWLYALIGISTLIVIHEAGHALAAKACGMKVVRFALFFPPLLLRRKIGGTEFAIGAIPLGGYVRILGQAAEDEIPAGEEALSYGAKPVWQRMLVIAAGPAANILAGIILISAVLMIDGEPKAVPVIAKARISDPAAGILKAGDRIVAIDGVRGGPDLLVRQTRTHGCPGREIDGCKAASPASVTFKRGSETRTVSVRPQYDGTAKAMRLGFSFSSESASIGPIDALGRSVGIAWRVSGQSVKGLLAISTPEGRKQVSGIVGVSVVTEQAFSRDLIWALELLALVSLLIAVVNLFPLLPLDGGHLFWLAVEGIRGRPVSASVLARATAVGLVVVAGLFFIGLSNDLVRLTGEGFPGPR